MGRFPLDLRVCGQGMVSSCFMASPSHSLFSRVYCTANRSLTLCKKAFVSVSFSGYSSAGTGENNRVFCLVALSGFDLADGVGGFISII